MGTSPPGPPPRLGADLDIISRLGSAWDDLKDINLYSLLSQEQKRRLYEMPERNAQKVLKAARVIDQLLFEPESDQRPIIRWLEKVLG